LLIISQQSLELLCVATCAAVMPEGAGVVMGVATGAGFIITGTFLATTGAGLLAKGKTAF
jgi:hypothetical protein